MDLKKYNDIKRIVGFFLRSSAVGGISIRNAACSEKITKYRSERASQIVKSLNLAMEKSVSAPPPICGGNSCPRTEQKNKKMVDALLVVALKNSDNASHSRVGEELDGHAPTHIDSKLLFSKKRCTYVLLI